MLALSMFCFVACGRALEQPERSARDVSEWSAASTQLEARPLGDSIPEILGTVVTGTFRGIYLDGFETSHFIHCDDGVTGVAGLAPAGIDMVPAIRGSTGAIRTIPTSIGGQQPATAIENANVLPEWHGLRIYYVEWRGTIRGPEHRYPSGDFAYFQRVDSVITARAMRATDCPRTNQFARMLPFRVDTAEVIAAAWPAAVRHLESPRIGMLSFSADMDTWSLPVSSGVVARLRALNIPVAQPARNFGDTDTAWTHVSALMVISQRRVRVVLETVWSESGGYVRGDPLEEMRVPVARSDTVDIACTPRYCP